MTFIEILGLFTILLAQSQVHSSLPDFQDGASLTETVGNSIQVPTQAEGDAVMQLKLARAYEHGDGVSQDTRLAAKWYTRAATQGNAEAQDRLGELLLTGEGIEQDKEAAITWFQRSARQGNASAMFNLGAAYYNGDEVGVSDVLSYAWFVLAREAGNQRAAEAMQRAESQNARTKHNERPY